jgi:stringent starvation protein B
VDGVDKKAFFEARLGTGSAFLHLDARRPGVRVPRAFAGDSHLVLQFGFNLAIPIPDLTVSDWGVRATLSFQRSPFLTAVPWSAVYAIHGDDGEGQVFREDLPPDLEDARTASSHPRGTGATADGGKAPGEGAGGQGKAGGKVRHLKLVE